MFKFPIFELIEKKILDYFDCPPNPSPKKVSIFWKYYIGGILLVSVILAVVVFIIVNEDSVRLIIIGSGFLIGFALSMWPTSKKTKEKIHKWWMGE